MIIITNNPKFIGYKDIKVEYKKEEYLDVLYRARNYIHRNHILLTHPLYGNITPTTTLYRTLILKENDSIDFFSVEIIENSINKVERIINTEKTKLLNSSIREDLKFIDYTLIIETIDQIK